MIQPDYKSICTKHLVIMDTFGYIYKNSNRLGKIYYKLSTNYYHTETIGGKKLEGQKSFEDALKILIGFV
jgi:hypothetical protein